MKVQLQSSALLLLATVIWGSAFLSQSIAAQHMGPFTFQTIRCFLAVLAMLPIIAVFDRSKKDGKSFFSRWADKKLWLGGLLCGLPLFLATNLQQMGLHDTDPGKSGFLTAMYIVFVPLIAVFRKEKPSPLIPVSLVLGVAGLYCLSCIGVTSIRLADLLLLGCALAFSVQITFVDYFADRVDMLRLNTLQALVCSVISAVFMLFEDSGGWEGIVASALPLLHTGVLSMGIAYGLQILGQKELPPSPAALIMSLESVFALLFGILFLHEQVDLWKGIGCALILCAVIVSQIPIKRKAKAIS